jgi:apoptotic chromatin condensation inducer in the nucleus
MTEWEKQTVAQLKDELKARGLPVSGKKADLIARLENAVSAKKQPSSDRPEDEEQAYVQIDASGTPFQEDDAPNPELQDDAPTDLPPVKPEDKIDTKPTSDRDFQQNEPTPPPEQPSLPNADETEEQDKKRKLSEEEEDAASVPETEQKQEPAPTITTTTTATTITTSNKKKKPNPRSEGKNNSKKPLPVSPKIPTTPTRALRIDGFVRPFTENAVKLLLSENGRNVVSMWMPTIKTHCFVVFSKQSEAEAACAELDGKQWPAASPKTLAVRYCYIREAEKNTAEGTGKKDFKVERTEEDGTEEEEEEEEEKEKKVEVKEDMAMEEERAAGDEGKKKEKTVVVEKKKKEEEEEKEKKPMLSLDELFKKTKAKPHIYWLPLTEEQIAAKKGSGAR